MQYKLSDAKTWSSHSFAGTGTSTSISGLTAGKTYEVQVQAANAEGNGPWSATGSAVTPGRRRDSQHRRELGGGQQRGRGGDGHGQP